MHKKKKRYNCTKQTLFAATLLLCYFSFFFHSDPTKSRHFQEPGRPYERVHASKVPHTHVFFHPSLLTPSLQTRSPLVRRRQLMEKECTYIQAQMERQGEREKGQGTQRRTSRKKRERNRREDTPSQKALSHVANVTPLFHVLSAASDPSCKVPRDLSKTPTRALVCARTSIHGCIQRLFC